MRRIAFLSLAFSLFVGAVDAAPPAEIVINLPAEEPTAAPPVVPAAAVPANFKAGAVGQNSVLTLPDGKTFVLVPREQMRVKAGTRSACIPRHLKAALATLPIPPPTYDWTKGNTIAFPILGNDQVGDCYYASSCHAVQLWMAMNGMPVTFSQAAVIARYRKLSGGDNGLSDSDIFGNNHNGEFYGGIVGPNGPHKILDHMTVDPSDAQAMALTQWAFGGHTYTCSLCNQWLNNAKPGALWDRGTPNPSAGHAIILSGKNAKGNYSLQTWAFNPPIEVTPAGILSSDPEIIVCFSVEWFDPQTGKAPNGLTYDELATLWKTLGGRTLPPSPFTPPTPVPPVPVPPIPVPPAPPPVPGTGWSGTITLTNGVVTAVTPGGVAPVGEFEAKLKAAGFNPAVVLADLLQLATDVRAKAALSVIMTDLFKIAADVGFSDPKVGILEPAPMPAQKIEKWARQEPTPKVETVFGKFQ